MGRFRVLTLQKVAYRCVVGSLPQALKASLISHGKILWKIFREHLGNFPAVNYPPVDACFRA